MMNGLEKEWDALATELGDDHDLAVLAAALEDRREGDKKELAAGVNSLIESRRGALQESQWIPGERLCAEKPKAFVKRLGRYWDARAAKRP